MSEKRDLQEVFSQFVIDGELEEIEELKRGHIHDTFVSTWTDGTQSRRYVHQRMNNHVFRDIDALMLNVSTVTEHIRGKLGQDDSDETLRVIPTRSEESYLIDGDEYWRTYDFIENTSTYFVCQNSHMAYEAAGACGRFLRYLVDLDPAVTAYTIPGFMDAEGRFEQFAQAVKVAIPERAFESTAEIAFAESQAYLGSSINSALRSGTIPLRVTHNDTKLNNVLFHEGTEKAFCIVDLDTCMPGSPLFDYGDLVRNTAIPVDEDEKDLSKVVFDSDLFAGVARGFMEAFGEHLNPAERELMIVAPRLLALTLGIRFLGDFLIGDTYFKVQYPEHNLVRARAQFQVARCMEQHADEMSKVLEGL
jgi:hypothetical protein